MNFYSLKTRDLMRTDTIIHHGMMVHLLVVLMTNKEVILFFTSNNDIYGDLCL